MLRNHQPTDPMCTLHASYCIIRWNNDEYSWGLCLPGKQFHAGRQGNEQTRKC